MPYLVRAEVEKPGSGMFQAEAETKRDAIEKARGLRSYGLVVKITDPKGQPVDEKSDLS
jgi:protein involved in polysaccharide export with SLBB domain